jgi:Mrp family chromosome partitioning ATPase
MPPVLARDDVIAFSPYLDAMILVVEEGKTTKDELSQAYESLDEAKILAAVLNKAEQVSAGVGYY